VCQIVICSVKSWEGQQTIGPRRLYRGNLGDDIGETGISCCVRGQCGSLVLGVGGCDGAIRHKRALAAVEATIVRPANPTTVSL
jgi:hypothetical protein